MTSYYKYGSIWISKDSGSSWTETKTAQSTSATGVPWCVPRGSCLSIQVHTQAHHAALLPAAEPGTRGSTEYSSTLVLN